MTQLEASVGASVTETVECASVCVRCHRPLTKEDMKSAKAATKPCRKCRKKERAEANGDHPLDERKVNRPESVSMLRALVEDIKADILAEANRHGKQGAVERTLARRKLLGQPTSVTDMMGPGRLKYLNYEPPLAPPVTPFTTAVMDGYFDNGTPADTSPTHSIHTQEDSLCQVA